MKLILSVMCFLLIATVSGDATVTSDSSAWVDKEYKRIELSIEQKNEIQRQRRSLDSTLQAAKIIRKDYDSLNQVVKGL